MNGFFYIVDRVGTSGLFVFILVCVYMAIVSKCFEDWIEKQGDLKNLNRSEFYTCPPIVGATGLVIQIIAWFILVWK